MSCPNSSESGCRCSEHHLGLLAFTVNEEHHTSLSGALDQIRDQQTKTLRVLTFDPKPPSNLVELPVCDGSMTCPCPDCDRERSRRVQHGGRRDDDPYSGIPVKIRRAA